MTETKAIVVDPIVWAWHAETDAGDYVFAGEQLPPDLGEYEGYVSLLKAFHAAYVEQHPGGANYTGPLSVELDREGAVWLWEASRQVAQAWREDSVGPDGEDELRKYNAARAQMRRVEEVFPGVVSDVLDDVAFEHWWGS